MFEIWTGNEAKILSKKSIFFFFLLKSVVNLKSDWNFLEILF